MDELCVRAWRRAYYAAVTYMDECVGELLAELDAVGAADNTVVAFFGDHGWHLGDLGMWEKFSNFEVATRTPLIFRRPPSWTTGASTVTAPVELVDVYRTLADLAGLEVPANESAAVDGVSLRPLMEGVGGEERLAFSQFPRCADGVNYAELPLSDDDAKVWDVYNGGDAPSRKHQVTGLPLWKLTNCRSASTIFQSKPSSSHPPFSAGNGIVAEDFDAMGLSVRSSEYRMTLWYSWEGGGVDWDADLMSAELYDHRGEDVDIFNGDGAEVTNLASDPDYAHVVADLTRALELQFRTE
jgi:iduronate 2-sulfatase